MFKKKGTIELCGKLKIVIFECKVIQNYSSIKEVALNADHLKTFEYTANTR